MTADRGDDRPDEEHGSEGWEEEPPRSLLGTTWFRVVLVVVVIAAVAAVSVPYVLDTMKPPPPQPAVAARPAASPTTKPPEPAAPTPQERAAEKPPAPDEKKSGTDAAAAAPVTASTTPSPPVSELKRESRPAVPAAEPKRAEKPTAVAGTASPASPAESRPQAKAPAAPEAKPEAKVGAKARRDERRAARAPSPRVATGKTIGGETGEYWVQVGAFRDAQTARRVAGRLKDQGFHVEESTMTRAASGGRAAAPAESAPGDRYDVFVAAALPAEVTARLAAKGLAAETVADGAVIKPSLPLREAVALSKDLVTEGFKVNVRRARAAESAPAPTPAPAGDETLHRVRVGAFQERGPAQAALRKLEEQGYAPFIARGRQ